MSANKLLTLYQLFGALAYIIALISSSMFGDSTGSVSSGAEEESVAAVGSGAEEETVLRALLRGIAEFAIMSAPISSIVFTIGDRVAWTGSSANACATCRARCAVRLAISHLAPATRERLVGVQKSVLTSIGTACDRPDGVCIFLFELDVVTLPLASIDGTPLFCLCVGCWLFSSGCCCGPLDLWKI
jgi:hypothetical protein